MLLAVITLNWLYELRFILFILLFYIDWCCFIVLAWLVIPYRAKTSDMPMIFDKSILLLGLWNVRIIFSLLISSKGYVSDLILLMLLWDILEQASCSSLFIIIFFRIFLISFGWLLFLRLWRWGDTIFFSSD